MATNPTESLAGFAANLSSDDLPPSARDMAKKLLLDAVACAIAADFGDETNDYAAFARTVGGPGETTVIGSGDQLSPLGAVLLNAYQITAATVCDTYVPAHVHITPEIIPVSLALAEREKSSGADLTAAIAVGSEIAVRVACGINYSVAGPRGWHMPGIVGPFGAAAAAGRLTHLSPLQMRNAFGLAGSQSAGTWASWGSPTVKFHQSRGAASGLLAGLLASTDFTSSANILTHADGGILSAYSDGGRPEALTERLGEHWEFEDIALRLWPGGTPLQPTLTAVFDLIAAHAPDFAGIEAVTINVAPDVFDAHARFDKPKGTFEALLSYHFAVASALRDRAFTLTSVGAKAIEDPALKAFIAEKVRLVSSPSLTRQSSEVAVKMANGSTYMMRADAAKGTRNNPASVDELKTKFRACANGRMASAEAEELMDMIVGLESVASLDRLFTLLRAPGPRKA